MDGMVGLGMNVDRKVWKKYICERIPDVGSEAWENILNETGREKSMCK